MLWEHSLPRTALDMCRILILTEGLAMLACVSRLGRGLGRNRGGLAMVLRDLLEWRPTVSHYHWVLQERRCADDQRRGEFRLYQLLDAVGCDPRGVRLDQVFH